MRRRRSALQVVKRWFLKGITGEPAHPGDLPAKPEPCWGPEAVVQAQLAALQEGDAGRIFRFASPGNRRATGPVERFAQMLQAPLYRPLLRHLSADLLRTVQMQPDLTLLIVGEWGGVQASAPAASISSRTVYNGMLGVCTPSLSCWRCVQRPRAPTVWFSHLVGAACRCHALQECVPTSPLPSWVSLRGQCTAGRCGCSRTRAARAAG